MNYKILTATLIVLIKSMMAFSGDVNYLPQRGKNKIVANCISFDHFKSISLCKLTDANTSLGQLTDTGGHMGGLLCSNSSNDIMNIEGETQVITSVSQIQEKDMFGRVGETASMNSIIAIEVGRDLILGIYNILDRNSGLVNSLKLIKI